MKYICTEDDNGRQEIFLFPVTVNHSAIAEVLGCIRNHTHGNNWVRVGRIPVSAGFVNTDGACHGESITLNLKSRPEKDTELLAVQFMVSSN